MNHNKLCVTMKSILAAFCCMFLFSACNEKKTNNTDGSLDPCTLRFSWWGGDDRHEATLEAIKLWNEKYPDIKIEAEYGGWDGWTEKLNTQVLGKTSPDIMQINYDWLINLSQDGLGFYDLNQLDDYIDFSGYSDELLSFGERNGYLNAITVSMSGRGFFYNSDTYKKVGAEYPKSWSELISLGNEFKEYGLYPLDLDIQSGATAWYLCVVYIQQSTGRQFITMDGELGFTQEDIKNALDFYLSLEQNNVIRTVQQRIDADGTDANYQSPSFIDGTIGGVLEWGSAVGKYEAMLPAGTLEAGDYLSDDSGNNSGWMIKPSLMYAISAYTEHPDEAAAFLNFLINDNECAEILGTTRGIPSNSNVYTKMESSGVLKGISYDSGELLNEISPISISPYMELSQLKEYYNNAIEKVSYGTATTQEAATEMYTLITKYLEKVR